MADIPGIIEGAHEGKGLGLKFLQHVERTRVLAYLVPLDSPDPRQAYDRLRDEIRALQRGTGQEPHVVLLTKRDLSPLGDPLPALEAPEAAGSSRFRAPRVRGLEELKEALWKFVEEAKASTGEQRGRGRPWINPATGSSWTTSRWMSQRLAYLALTQVPGLGPARLQTLSRRLSHPTRRPFGAVRLFVHRAGIFSRLRDRHSRPRRSNQGGSLVEQRRSCGRAHPRPR